MVDKFQKIANVLRRDSLVMTSSAGSGHPSSCLSCAEIMSVLFFDEMRYDVKNPFNPDNDEFILSKGHASPILYASLFRAGCIKNKLEDLRKLRSPLEGHPLPRSLDWIKVGTGSLGQGLSVGVGMCLATKLQKRKFRTFVLVGDSESAEGSVYEALELAVYYGLNNLITIIDINRLGQRGETMIGHDIEKYNKKFSGFGCNVISIDGHDVGQIIRAFRKTRSSKKPVVILAKTFKGRGVSFLEDKENWHGKALSKEQLGEALNQIPKFDMPKVRIKKPDKIKFNFEKKRLKRVKFKDEEIATRKAYGMSLARLAESNSAVIAVDAEVSNSTYSEEVKKIEPKQFIEGFIAEQNMIGMSLGLSIKGFNVFASSFAAFLSRAYDQIRMANISDGNFTICGSHAGVSIGEDGASQMGLEDISMFRNLVGSSVFYPSDAVSSEKLTVLASRLKGMKYIRTTRSKTSLIYDKNENFGLGDFKILRESKKDKAVLVGSGITTHEALKAYEELQKKKVNVAVVDLYCVKPFNYDKFAQFVKKHGNRIILAEDHHKEGGIGEMIAGGIVGSGIKMKHLAIEEIPHSGTKEELLRKYGVDSTSYERGFFSKD